jgi:2-keto-4-pentenoate hydratase/2-oxohepta-3-ene-1,7-dioic acid hydratase in catechol pathway
MRFATVLDGNRLATVVVLPGDRAIPLETVLKAPGAPELSSSAGVSPARSLLQAGPELRARLDEIARDIAYDDEVGVRLSEATFAPPVPDPSQIFCLGMNYAAHVEEAGGRAPAVPEFFVKLPGSLVGHRAPIVMPRVSDKIDYEGELVAVVGRRTKNATTQEAQASVAGVTILNDVSARDLQLAGSQWLPGKILDTFAPCGPIVATDEDLNWQEGLELQTRLNGAVMQAANTRSMLTSIAEAVAYLSSLVTLLPGDLIATGTPAGVGFTRDPPVYLRAGDVVAISIEGVGTLENPVVAAA